MNWTIRNPHPWDLTPREATALQTSLAGSVREAPFPTPGTVAGIDVSVRGDRVRTAVVVVRIDDLETVDAVTWEGAVTWPYVPGLLSFREIPAVLPALARLSVRPDVLMVDGQGTAHPRRFGLACHLGLLLDHPAFGVAKSRLCGTHVEPAPVRGSSAPLVLDGERIGTVLRTRTGVRPVFVSAGHRVTLADAEAVTFATAPRYRIPEPTRRAHLLSKRG